jgi:two-component system phosphate regulon sensor histidine kinase PhoR
LSRSLHPAAGDVRRLLAWFVGLVVLPVIGLVAFGVLAIFNERGAVERRFQEGYGVRLRALAADLAGSLDDEAMQVGAHLPPREPRRVGFSFRLEGVSLSTAPAIDPARRQGLATVLAGVGATGGKSDILPVETGPARGLFVVHRDGASLHGIGFSEEALAAEVEARGRSRFPGDEARFVLRRVEYERPRDGPLSALLSEAVQGGGAFDPLSLSLPVPLAGWNLKAVLDAEDPVRRVLWRNRTISIVALVLFYGVITAGIVVTVRGISREMRLSRLRTDFVSNVSHELRTPLTSIRLFAETLTLERAVSTEEQRFCAETILRETERLSRIAERTLDWARLEAGRRIYDRRPTDVGLLVSDVVASFRSLTRFDERALSYRVEADAAWVNVDPDALGQVVLNLLENAAKYTADERRIDVRVASRGRWVMVSVTDNGIGIARREQRRIFDRFYRADDLLSRRTEGSGLGLSIAKVVVEQHGGRIGVESAPGAGSTFTVSLPRIGPPEHEVVA